MTTTSTNLLRAMWREFQRLVDNRMNGDADYRWQQKTIRRLAKKYFNVELKWRSITSDKRDDSYGWPTEGYWPTNQRWFSSEIKRLLGEK